MKKFLLSRSNFSFECEEYWKTRRGLPITLVSANGARKSIDLLKLSLMSSHVMDLKNSFEIPDSLSHLLDIDIILPDFSENVVKILCDVIEGGNSEVVANNASFSELNELIEVLNVALGPGGLTKDNNNLEYCEGKDDGFMKEANHSSLTNVGNKLKLVPISQLINEAEDSRAGNEDMDKIKMELKEVKKLNALKDTAIETQKKGIFAKDSKIKADETTIFQLKKIGRHYREKVDALEETLKELTGEKKKIGEELVKVIEIEEKKKIEHKQEVAEEKTKVMQLMKIGRDYREKVEALKKIGRNFREKCENTQSELCSMTAKYAELLQQSSEEEVKAKADLSDARVKILKLEEENKQLEKKLEEITKYNSVSTDKDRLEGDKSETLKETLIEQVEQFQQELVVASQMSSQGDGCSPAGFSPSAPTTANVSPTLKRPREQTPNLDSPPGPDQEIGYLGDPKKAKTAF